MTSGSPGAEVAVVTEGRANTGTGCGRKNRATGWKNDARMMREPQSFSTISPGSCGHEARGVWPVTSCPLSLAGPSFSVFEMLSMIFASRRQCRIYGMTPSRQGLIGVLAVNSTYEHSHIEQEIALVVQQSRKKDPAFSYNSKPQLEATKPQAAQAAARASSSATFPKRPKADGQACVFNTHLLTTTHMTLLTR